MSYVAPNTVVHLLSGVPLTPDYKDTVFFATNAEQANAFYGNYLKYTLTNFTYVRERNVLRVPFVADNILMCNYMMYQNRAFGSHWFYAFITQIDYINDGMSEIHFEIDVMQTWAFDYLLSYAFVERKHVSVDNVYNWSQPENIDLGYFIDDNVYATGLFENQSVLICSSDVETSSEVAGLVAGVFSGCKYIVAGMNNSTQAEYLKEFLAEVVNDNKVDTIVSLVQMPTNAIGEVVSATPNYTINVPKYQETLGDYTPRNKKLTAYPYNFCYCTNQQGGSLTLKYELFDTSTMNFQIYCSITGNPVIGMYPKDYAGEAESLDNVLFITNFPQCAFSYDAYAAWLAQGGGVNSLISGLSSGVGAVASLLSGNVSGAVSSALGVAGVMADYVQQMNAPDCINGVNGGNWYTSAGAQDFVYYQRHVNEFQAAVIDDYFDKYGYAINRYTTVDRNTRPHWNYVKTKDCTPRAIMCPSEAIDKIAQIYDSGITFWQSISEVGDYSLDNRLSES